MSRRFTRRRFLKSAVSSAGLAAAASLLAACPTAPTPTSVAPNATRGRPTATPMPATPTALPTPTPAYGKTMEQMLRDNPPARFDPPIEIEVVSWQPDGWPDFEIQTDMSREFSELHPGVTVKLIGTGTLASWQDQKLRLQAHTPPEVMAFAKASDVGQTKEAWEAGFIYALDKEMAEASFDTPGKSWWQTIQPVIHVHLQWLDHVIAWPTEVTYNSFFYDRKLFDKYNLAPPKTWTEFLGVCETLKRNGIGPIIISGAENYQYQMWYEAMLQRLIGTDSVTALLLGQKGSWKSPEPLHAAELLWEIFEKGYLVEGYTNLDSFAAWALFVQGTGGILIDGTWILESRDRFQGLDMDLFRFPAIEGGKGTYEFAMGTSNIQNVAAEAKHPKLGAEWGRMRNSVKWQSVRAERMGYTIPIDDVNPGRWEPVQRAAKLFSETKEFPMWGWNLANHAPELNTKMGQICSKFWLKELTPQQLIDALDREWAQHYAEKKG